MAPNSFKHDILAEEFIKGIPEFVLRQTTENYVEQIKDHLVKHILMWKSTTEAQRQLALAAADETMNDLEKKILNLLESSLHGFVNQF